VLIVTRARARACRRTATRVSAILVAVTVVLGPGPMASSGTVGPRVARVMTVVPSIGLPGLPVRFSGRDVPRHLHITVLFDVTTKDKRKLCVASNGAHTTWRCVGRIPAHYGSLGIHTVEMDATMTATGVGFEELATFLVTDLGVTMAAPATTAPGDTVQLRVTTSNGNSVVAHGVTVTDALPAALRLTHAPRPCTSAAGHITCGPFRMPARSSRVFVFTTIVAATHRTRFTDTVSIRGSPDPLHRNDAAHAAISVT
jgi:uncharacterized repeat protein (TIGR01451 family)